MKHWMPILLLFLILMPVPALAQAGMQIEVDPGDTPLVITGWLGEENAFVGNLRLTAQGGDVATFTFLASDLTREEGDEVIGRQQVNLVGDPTLSADVPKNFQVTVTGPPMPGTYQGQIEVLLPGQARAEAPVIPLTVVAKARPALTLLPGTDRVQLRLVRCGRGLDCALARLLLPDSAFLDGWQLQFDNPVQAPVTVVNAEVVVIGERTGYQLTAANLALPQGQQTLPANQIVSLPLTLTRQAMPPDHYTGAFYLTLDGRDERLTIPVDLSVRTGPLWALLALLLGIVLGRLFKYMQERGRPQAEALQAVNRLQALVRAAHPDDQKILAPMIEAVRKLVYREKLETEAKAPDWLDRLVEEIRAKAAQGKHPSLAFLMESLLNELMTRERDRHLEDHPRTRPTGCASATFISSWTSLLGVPWVRSGKTFRPAILPPRWKRAHKDCEELLIAMLDDGYSQALGVHPQVLKPPVLPGCPRGC